MSEVKVNKISPRTNCGTVTLGDSGDSITIPSGVTITNSGTAAGFGSTGEVSWNTTVKTGDFTASDGEGYFINTTSGEITMTLPAGTAGAIVAFKDYLNTFDTNKLTVTPNGSDKIGGTSASATFTPESQSVTLIFTDSIRGWVDIHDSTSNATGATFISATGGTVSCSGNFKIHTFTSPGTFCVSSVSNIAANNVVDYLVVAGGGGGGSGCGAGGGGGAGGFRFFANTTNNPQSGPGAPRNGYGSPSPSGTQITLTAQGYPIAVGGGGNGGDGDSPGASSASTSGAVSTFYTVNSTGGGAGLPGSNPPGSGCPGGSGGGNTRNRGSTGSGNTPSVTPSQGSNGGNGTNPLAGNGGGGAMAVGSNSNPPSNQPTNNEGGPGGAGAGITGFGSSNGQCSSCVQYFSGGGGGGTFNNATCTQTPGDNARGGIGGGGAGALAPTHPGSPNKQVGVAGTDNTGGGGGGGGEAPVVGTTPNDGDGGNGGSGIVVIRYKFQ